MDQLPHFLSPFFSSPSRVTHQDLCEYIIPIMSSIAVAALIISCSVLGVSVARLFPVKEWIHHMCPNLWPLAARHDASTPTDLESSRNAAELITPALDPAAVQRLIDDACVPLRHRIAVLEELRSANRVQTIGTSSSSQRGDETQLSDVVEAADNEGSVQDASAI